MAQEAPQSIASEIKAFNSVRNPNGARKREIIVGGMSNGLYRLTVEHRKKHLGIGVVHKYDRRIHHDELPYYKEFHLDFELDGQDGVVKSKRNLKQELKVGYSTIRKNGMEGLNAISNDINANYPTGRFWATVDLPSGEEVKLGYVSDNKMQAMLETIAINGVLIPSDEFAVQYIKQIEQAGLDVPTVIDLVATVKKLLTQQLSPKEMRDNPFVGMNLPFGEQRNYERTKDMGV